MVVFEDPESRGTVWGDRKGGRDGESDAGTSLNVAWAVRDLALVS